MGEEKPGSREFVPGKSLKFKVNNTLFFWYNWFSLLCPLILILCFILNPKCLCLDITGWKSFYHSMLSLYGIQEICSCTINLFLLVALWEKSSFTFCLNSKKKKVQSNASYSELLMLLKVMTLNIQRNHWTGTMISLLLPIHLSGWCLRLSGQAGASGCSSDAACFCKVCV